MTTDFDFDTFLSSRAERIVERHRAQDRQRSHANRARIAEIHEIKALENAALRTLRYLAGFRYFEGRNPQNQLIQLKAGAKSPAVVAAKPKSDETGQQIAETKRRLGKLRAQRERLEASAPEPVLTSTRILADVQKWRELDVDEVPRPMPTLAKGERSLLDALPRLRETVAALKSDRRLVQRSPLPAAAVKRIAHEHIKRLAARGQPRVMGLFTGGELELPKLPATALNGPYFSQAIDAAALSTYLLHDLLIERVDELIDINAAAFDKPLSVVERTKQLALLDSQIDETERLEAAAVEALIADGREVFHRPDISVLAVLSYAIR